MTFDIMDGLMFLGFFFILITTTILSFSLLEYSFVVTTFIFGYVSGSMNIFYKLKRIRESL